LRGVSTVNYRFGVWWVPRARLMLNTTEVRQLFFRMLPLTPTRKIFARLDMNVAADTSSHLVNQFHHLYRLQQGEGHCAIRTTHGYF